MGIAYAMLDRIRALLIVIEEGSVSRAAVRLRIAQPALSRQMKLLESEVGGKLLERETSGVKPTGLGHALAKAMRPVIDSYDAALEEVRHQARGSGGQLRVGFLISAAQHILTPAMDQLRRSHPDLKLKLFDMSPKEQIDALRGGKTRHRTDRPGGRGGGGRFPLPETVLVRGVCGALDLRSVGGPTGSVDPGSHGSRLRGRR